ncbi:hypothetical protein GCM10007881_44260 [Mesorhizobium huakuii]|uniref:hypothetical protein n=1 Tax=Mesorhizobium huakuii TaxID=28104 RepID=UPI00235CD27E|nr:hypothetical protein [Mesorhizobium huakuii]GLQ80905.1 hypothetical protein GCM10007881_44260 [Mesorhizobium huakuii]
MTYKIDTGRYPADLTSLARAPQSTLCIRAFRHKFFEATAQEWLDRYCNLGKYDDALRFSEVVETLRLPGLKGRIARYARKDRNGAVSFRWVWERNYYVAEGYASLEAARADLIRHLWEQFERLEDKTRSPSSVS